MLSASCLMFKVVESLFPSMKQGVSLKLTERSFEKVCKGYKTPQGSPQAKSDDKATLPEVCRTIPDFKCVGQTSAI